MANFDVAMEYLFALEGRDSDHPRDPGGLTVWGLSVQHDSGWEGWKWLKEAKASREHWKMTLESDALRDSARRYWRKNYWSRISGDAFRSQAIANEMFEAGANCGCGRVVRWLQQVLGAMNWDDSTGKPLAAPLRIDGLMPERTRDGRPGKTLTLLRRILGQRGAVDRESVILKTLNGRQATRYCQVARNNPALRTFFLGWIDKRVSYETERGTRT